MGISYFGGEREICKEREISRDGLAGATAKPSGASRHFGDDYFIERISRCKKRKELYFLLKNKKTSLSLKSKRLALAEKERFELSLRLSRTTPLAGEPLRPLGYFSKPN